MLQQTLGTSQKFSKYTGVAATTVLLISTLIFSMNSSVASAQDGDASITVTPNNSVTPPAKPGGTAVAKPLTNSAVAKPLTNSAVAKPLTNSAVAKPQTSSALAKPLINAAEAKPLTSAAVAKPTAAAPTKAGPKQKTTLITLRDGIIVYSAPGQNYRPLAILPDKTVLLAASKPTKGKQGDFYKVLVSLSPKQRAIGYIPTTAEVRLNTNVETVDSDDLEKFGPIALVKHAFQLSYSRFINSEYEWSLGYMRYISPGFYLKGLGGQFVTPLSSGTVAGFEIGNDALLYKNISVQLSYSAGVLIPGQAGAVFIGSKSVNGFAQGIVALRYNLRGVASASLGGTQIALLNANNSFVTYGANATLEIGL